MNSTATRKVLHLTSSLCILPSVRNILWKPGGQFVGQQGTGLRTGTGREKDISLTVLLVQVTGSLYKFQEVVILCMLSCISLSYSYYQFIPAF